MYAFPCSDRPEVPGDPPYGGPYPLPSQPRYLSSEDILAEEKIGPAPNTLPSLD